MNKYLKNFILSGEIDFHCIICEESFTAAVDVEKHIRWENHRKKLKTQSHVHKYKNEGIFKIGNLYYCEFCNLVFPDIQSVKLHVTKESHKTNKVTPKEFKQPIVKRESGIIKISNFPISHTQWHGIFDKECLLCNENITDLNKHTAQTSHMARLIESECKIDDEDKCYRKINDKFVQCFSCRFYMLSASFDGHFDTDVHRDNLAAIKVEKANKDANPADKQQTFKSVFEKYRLLFDIDEEKATCKKCDETFKLDFETLRQHVELHESKDDLKEEALKYVIFDHGKRRSELAKYGKRNFIKMAEKPGKGYCTICCCYLSAHMNIFTDHVQGVRHSGILKIKEQERLGITEANSTQTPSVTLKSFLKDLHYSAIYRVLYINEEVCTTPVNLLLFTEMDYAKKRIIKCYCCDVEVPSTEMWKHFAEDSHKKTFFNTKVVTGLSHEFVREIRPNIFHCVYCNIILPYWTTMKRHIESLPHRFTKLPYLRLAHDGDAILSCKPLLHLETESVLYSQLLLCCTFSKME